MSLTLFLILMIAPAFVGGIIGLVLMILEKPKEQPIHPRPKFKRGDIVELKSGHVATVTLVDWKDLWIAIKGLEQNPYSLTPDGADPMKDIVLDFSISKVIGSVNYVV